jgi:hypothetical protein
MRAGISPGPPTPNLTAPGHASPRLTWPCHSIPCHTAPQRVHFDISINRKSTAKIALPLAPGIMVDRIIKSLIDGEQPMLARYFLTPKQLNCSQLDIDAAIKLLGMLERGELEFVELKEARGWDGNSGQYYDVGVLPHGTGLNMGWWDEEDEDGNFCGCLGGWMERLKGRPLSNRMVDAWEDLFYPATLDSRNDHSFTPARCARALHTKLTTGCAQW